MPVMRTRPPENRQGHHGEFELYQILQNLLLPRTELWFNLSLPMVKEIDLILNEPSLGTYIAEVKSFYLDDISDYSLDSIILSTGEVRKNPIEQVKLAEIGLRNLLERNINQAGMRAPWMQRTAIWPRISRASFLEKFQRPLVADQARGMIFKDDLDEADTLLNALAAVTDNHCAGHVPAAVRMEQPGTQILRDLTVDLITIQAPNLETHFPARERDELISSGKKSSSRLEKYFSGEGIKVAFRGYPGSGKTMALREIGLQRYLKGESVLYVCYNKTLATKFRQEVAALIARGTKSEGSFLVHDAWDLYASLSPKPKLGTLRTVVIPAVETLRDSGELALFDTILIDESQDLDGEAFEIINLLSKPTSSFFAAYGDYQQLYNVDRYNGSHSPELDKFLESAQIEQFNRNFRGGPASQLVCSAISDFYPNVDKALEWLHLQVNSRNNRKNQGQLEFDEFVYEPKIIMSDTPEEYSHQRFLLESVSKLVESTQDSNNGNELDALVLVASSASKNYQKILEYFKLFEIPHLDLVQTEYRRTAPKPSEIVITTFHSARGLTCKACIVADIDLLEKNADRKDYAPVQNLLNIALSRATGTTMIVTGAHETEYLNRPVLQYLSAVIEMLETDLI